MAGLKHEIEIKTLLFTKEAADKLLTSMKSLDPSCRLISANKQLNHYFVAGKFYPDLPECTAIVAHLSAEQRTQLAELWRKTKDFSLRSRYVEEGANKRTIIVLKAAVDDTTSANGIKRAEFEAELPISMEILDRSLLDFGFEIQSKWSRERSEYRYKDASVSIDKNAGYGYVAEFEMTSTDLTNLDNLKEELHVLMAELDVQELSQEKLQKMFDYYNSNWQTFYGSDNTFGIDENGKITFGKL